MLAQTITKHEFSTARTGHLNGNYERAAPQPRSIGRETSDASLIRSIGEGDKHAFQALFDRYNTVVFRFALRLVRDESTAEDVVSEVFFDAWRQARKFEGRSRVSTWLLAIARNKALTMLRRCSEAQLDESAATAVEDPTDDAAIAIEKKERSTILQNCLTQLSAKHREIIDLVYYHGQSIDEVAAIIRIPPNTVKTRMHYARLQMAKYVAAAGLDRASLRL
jgi:RNA polymerase sigma-70 factor (ECF subfamily)